MKIIVSPSRETCDYLVEYLGLPPNSYVFVYDIETMLNVSSADFHSGYISYKLNEIDDELAEIFANYFTEITERPAGGFGWRNLYPEEVPTWIEELTSGLR